MRNISLLFVLFSFLACQKNIYDNLRSPVSISKKEIDEYNLLIQQSLKSGDFSTIEKEKLYNKPVMRFGVSGDKHFSYIIPFLHDDKSVKGYLYFSSDATGAISKQDLVSLHSLKNIDDSLRSDVVFVLQSLERFNYKLHPELFDEHKKLKQIESDHPYKRASSSLVRSSTSTLRTESGAPMSLMSYMDPYSYKCQLAFKLQIMFANGLYCDAGLDEWMLQGWLPYELEKYYQSQGVGTYVEYRHPYFVIHADNLLNFNSEPTAYFHLNSIFQQTPPPFQCISNTNFSFNIKEMESYCNPEMPGTGGTGGTGGGSGGSSTTFTAVAPMVTINLQNRLNCFNTIPDNSNTKYRITLHAHNGLVGLSDKPGHAYITLEKTNGNQHQRLTYGFYPAAGTVSATMLPVASAIGEESGNPDRQSDARYHLNLDKQKFDLAIATSLSLAQNDYDLNDNNCVHYATDVFNTMNPPTGQINNNGFIVPSGLYVTLKNLQQAHPFAEIGVGRMDPPISTNCN